MAVKCVDVTSRERGRLGDLVVPSPWWRPSDSASNAVISGGQTVTWYWWKSNGSADFLEAPNTLLVLPFSLQRPQRMMSPRREVWCFAISASHCKSEVGGIFSLEMQLFTSFPLFLHLGRKELRSLPVTRDFVETETKRGKISSSNPQWVGLVSPCVLTHCHELTPKVLAAELSPAL